MSDKDTVTTWEKPALSLLVKLGGLLIHAEEFMEPGGSPLDLVEFKQGMKDADVQNWIREGVGMALLPLKRSIRAKP
jgi:hypothetical protein